jgi:hypothetical protein
MQGLVRQVLVFSDLSLAKSLDVLD